MHSGSSLQVSWFHPEDDGGDMVTKYKIEWDPSETFDSSNGSPLGSHHKVLTSPAHDCKLVPCNPLAFKGLKQSRPLD